MRIANGLCSDHADASAYARAAERARHGLGGDPADVALIFAGGDAAAEAAEGVAAVQDVLAPAALAGCGAQGVVAAGRELEEGGVAVWAASFPDADVSPFRLDVEPADGGLAVRGVPDLDDADLVVMLADPASLPVEPLLEQMGQHRSGAPVVGGLASGGPPALLGPDGPLDAGATGVVLRGVDVRACVSQGARPVGPEMTVTDADGGVVHELAGQPAVERLREAVSDLEAGERALAAGGLLIGVVIDHGKPDYERGDFLVRGLLGADEDTGSITVGAQVRVGQTLRLQVRDAATAHEDLEQELDRQLGALPGRPAGALLFTCNGRGTGMFGAPDHDARAVSDAFRGAPVAGFLCAGEIGPVGGRSFVHGFTATLAVFGP